MKGAGPGRSAGDARLCSIEPVLVGWPFRGRPVCLPPEAEPDPAAPGGRPNSGTALPTGVGRPIRIGASADGARRAAAPSPACLAEAPTRAPRVGPVVEGLLLTFVNEGTGGDANASERF